MKKMIILCICVFFLCSCGKKVEMELYCEEGTLEGNRCKIVETAEAQFTCPDGFPLNEETKKCENIISMPAPYKMGCVEGYYLENGKCISDITYERENGKCPDGISVYMGQCKDIKYRIKIYECQNGTVNEETSKCDLVDDRNPTEIKCDEGYKYNKKIKKCEKINYIEPSIREVEG